MKTKEAIISICVEFSDPIEQTRAACLIHQELASLLAELEMGFLTRTRGEVGLITGDVEVSGG